jgi:hypothetical protein
MHAPPWQMPFRRHVGTWRLAAWRFGAWRLAAIAWVLIGVVYVSGAWTPSHYSIVLNLLGSDQRPTLGLAQTIRSDEAAVLTPYFQIAVRNQFGPRDEISPYKEPLKSFWALPIADWGLVFKPHLWGFWLVPPAQAFSLYYFLQAAAFVAGFALLFRQLGATAPLALLGSLVLWASHFVQAYWTSNAAGFAFAPWAAVAFLAPLAWYWRFAAIFYATAVWLVGLLYPPFTIAGALAIGVLLLAFRRDALTVPRAAVAAAAVLAACAVTWLYFRDIAAIMQDTVYPGQRHSDGGGVPLPMVLAHVLPYWTTIRFRPLLPEFNTCGIAVVASFLPLTVAVFVDYRSLAAFARRNALSAGILLAAMAVMLAWMTLPVPHAIGRVLLLDRVPGIRMLWGFGVCLTAALVVIMTHVSFRVTWPRCAIFVAMVIGAWLAKAFVMVPHGIGARHALTYVGFDLVVLAPFAVAVWMIRKSVWMPDAPTALLGVVAATSLITFGIFNPLQSAKPIFDPPRIPFVEELRQRAATDRRGWVMVELKQPGVLGAALNGLGIPAINHVLMAPRLDFFRPLFADLSAHDFNQIFNRYAHIMPQDVPAPLSPQADVIVVPVKRFDVPLMRLPPEP